MKPGDSMYHTNGPAHCIREVRSVRVLTECMQLFDADEMEHNDGERELCVDCVKAMERRADR